MKKTYLKPMTLTVAVQLTQMVALSTMQGPADNSEVLGRESGGELWDDEDY